MIRRLFRWALYLFIILVVLSVAAILLLDTAARSVAQSQIRGQTGLDAKIGKFTIGLASPTVTIEQLTLFNNAEFGGSPMVKMPELHVEYDREALARGEIHLKLVRLNLEEVHVVENQKGETNIKELEKRQEAATGKGTNQGPSQVKFTGIDTLNLTIDRAKFTSARRPNQNREVKIGIQNEVFKNIKSEKDLEAVVVSLALKKGATFLMEGVLSSSGALLQNVTNAAPEAKKLFDNLIPRKK